MVIMMYKIQNHSGLKLIYTAKKSNTLKDKFIILQIDMTGSLSL